MDIITKNTKVKSKTWHHVSEVLSQSSIRSSDTSNALGKPSEVICFVIVFRLSWRFSTGLFRQSQAEKLHYLPQSVASLFIFSEACIAKVFFHFKPCEAGQRFSLINNVITVGLANICRVFLMDILSGHRHQSVLYKNSPDERWHNRIKQDFTSLAVQTSFLMEIIEISVNVSILT